MIAETMHGAAGRGHGYAEATLAIDLDALKANFATMAARAHPAECAAAVKCDGYGLGVEPVARALSGAGCRTFFVALLDEGMVLREILPEATIYVLNGLAPNTAPVHAAHRLRPVLGSLEEIAEWSAHCTATGRRLEAAIHVDTGINRLGLSEADVARLASEPRLAEAFDVTLIISHLACSDQPDHPMNARQAERFDALLARLPPAPASLANSGGVLNGRRYTYDLVRPGIALYGADPRGRGDGSLKPVVRLTGRILQVRTLAAGDCVGYGATWRATRPTRIALVSVGYGDGYLRALGTTTGERRTMAAIGGHRVPVTGRISMDTLAVDVTDLDSGLAVRGGEVELIGDTVALDEVAAWAGTIPYEVLTNLGSRYARIYKGLDPD